MLVLVDLVARADAKEDLEWLKSVLPPWLYSLLGIIAVAWFVLTVVCAILNGVIAIFGGIRAEMVREHSGIDPAGGDAKGAQRPSEPAREAPALHKASLPFDVGRLYGQLARPLWRVAGWLRQSARCAESPLAPPRMLRWIVGYGLLWNRPQPGRVWVEVPLGD